MKTKALFLMAMAIAVLTQTSCSEEDTTLGNNTQKDGGLPVSILVSDKGFNNSSNTRAADSNNEMTEDGKTVMSTEFVDGDSIGVFAITKQNIPLNNSYVNRLLIMKNGKWTAADGKEFLYYNGVDYFAYYPYKIGKKIADVDPTKHTAPEFFRSHIDTFEPYKNQETAFNYTHSDLMVGQGTLVGTTCQFKMQHMMGLIVIQVPTITHHYKQANDPSCEYDVKELYLMDKTEKRVRQLVEGEPIYRYIVRPNAVEALTGKTYTDVDGNFNIFAITHSGVNGGFYKKYVVDGATNTSDERTYNLGDYYYDDGTISPLKIDHKTVFGVIAYCGKTDVTKDVDYLGNVKQYHTLVMSASSGVYNNINTSVPAYKLGGYPNGLCFGDLKKAPGHETKDDHYYEPSISSFIPTCEEAIADFGGVWKTDFLIKYRKEGMFNSVITGATYSATATSWHSWGTFGILTTARGKKPSSNVCTTSNVFQPTFGQVVGIMGSKGIGQADDEELKSKIRAAWTSGKPAATSNRFVDETLVINMKTAMAKAGFIIVSAGVVLSQYDKDNYLTLGYNTTGSYIQIGVYYQNTNKNVGTSTNMWYGLAF